MQPDARAESSVIDADSWMHLGHSLRLSQRELQIVQRIFDDQEQENIAAGLGIGVDVVYRTVQRIYIKLRVGSRAELIVRVMVEHFALVADQAHPELFGLAYWPVTLMAPRRERHS
jgi:DNA-binding CsgD family transcriptional regulator